MKKILLLLLLLPVGHLSMGQATNKTGSSNTKTTAPAKKQPTSTAKPAATKAAGTTTTKAKPAATPASQKPAAKPAATAAAAPASAPVAVQEPTVLIWRNLEMHEALKLYLKLNYEEAYRKFKEAGANGEGAAYYFIGRMHHHAQLRNNLQPDSLRPIDPTVFYTPNLDSAKIYYQMALQENNLLGNLGIAELMVLRSKDDKQQFLRLMRSAAVEIREKAIDGDPFCTRILGSMYYTGYGEMQDKEYAFNYLLKAAKMGDVAAYVDVANLYLSGDGVEKSEEQAMYWLKKGAEAGEREAIYTLALVHEEGLIGEVNVPKAKQLYNQAVAKGSAVAFEQLKYVNQSTDQKLVIGSITRNPDMIKRALTAGAKVNSRAIPDGFGEDFKNRTALMHTIFIPLLLEDYGVIYEPEVRLHAVSLLLKNGADVAAIDQEGKTALHYALVGARINTELFEIEQAQLLDTLLKHKADPNIQDLDGNTPLHYAIEFTNGQHEMELGRLLTGGANPSIQNKQGMTALMLACNIGASNEVILALLHAGADPKLRDIHGKAAIDYAKSEAVTNILMASGSPAAKR